VRVRNRKSSRELSSLVRERARLMVNARVRVPEMANASVVAMARREV